MGFPGALSQVPAKNFDVEIFTRIRSLLRKRMRILSLKDQGKNNEKDKSRKREKMMIGIKTRIRIRTWSRLDSGEG